MWNFWWFMSFDSSNVRKWTKKATRPFEVTKKKHTTNGVRISSGDGESLDIFPKRSKGLSLGSFVIANMLHSLKLTAKAPENRPGPKRKFVFQPSIFRCELLVSGSVDSMKQSTFFAIKAEEDKTPVQTSSFTQLDVHLLSVIPRMAQETKTEIPVSKVQGPNRKKQVLSIKVIQSVQMHIGVSKNRGGPPKWMVYNGKPY